MTTILPALTGPARSLAASITAVISTDGGGEVVGRRTRTKPFTVSVTKAFPLLSTATPAGLEEESWDAGSSAMVIASPLEETRRTTPGAVMNKYPAESS